MGADGGYTDMERTSGVPVWVVLLVMFIAIVVCCVVAKCEKVPIVVKGNIYATEWYDTVTDQFRGWGFFRAEFEIIKRIPDKNGLLDSIRYRTKRYSLGLSDSLYNQRRSWQTVTWVKIPSPPVIGTRVDTFWIDTTTWHPPMTNPKTIK